jgi:hypothetical protein
MTRLRGAPSWYTYTIVSFFKKTIILNANIKLIILIIIYIAIYNLISYDWLQVAMKYATLASTCLIL